MQKINKFFSHSIEKVAEKIFQKTLYGNLTVSFPSGKINYYKGSEKGIQADLRLKNFQ